MEKLALLDYNTKEVHIWDVDSEAAIDEEYLSDLGFHTSECNWMFGEDIEVIFHKEVLK